MFESLFLKLTTKPVWYYERRRHYPIRQLSQQLPAIESGQHQRTLAILTTPDTFADALWSGWSWLRFLQPHLSLRFYVDGQVSDTQQKTVQKLFPGATVSNLHRSIASQQIIGKNLRNFVESYSLGQKCALIMSLQEKSDVLYSDFDVLAFNSPEEILQSIKSSNNRIAYNRQIGQGSFDQHILNNARKLKIEPPAGFNAGLMWIPHKSLNYQLAEELLEGFDQKTSHAWFSEQTLFACLASSHGCQALPPARYIVDTQRQFYWQSDVDYQSIAARHFIYPVRHVMYLKGQPEILKQSLSYPPTGG